MGVTVLLTAAVAPHAGIAVHLLDPEARRAHYRAAFRFWSGLAADAGFGLCVVESTGACRDDFADVLGGAEWVPVEPDPALAARGKGALEAQMIDVATAAIAGRSARGTVYKVTGRLSVLNAGAIFRDLPGDTAVARGVMDRSRLDVRCIGASTSVWRGALQGMAADVDETAGVDLGNVAAARLVAASVRKQLDLVRFDARPQIRGSSGTRGSAYGSARHRIAERALSPAEDVLAWLSRRKSL